MKTRLVVIGAGMASGRMLEHLVKTAPDAFEITLFNAENRGNYNRLMLSPVLAGEKTYEEIVTHDAQWYADHGITTRFGERVTMIDRASKTVIGEHGPVPYDRLVIATGSNPFVIPMPGHDLPGVISWRDWDDTQVMIGQQQGTRAVVLGGGVLGLEAAAGMAARGMDVTVVHLESHLMNRQLDAEAGAMLARTLEARGLKIRCSRASEAIVAGPDGHVAGLRLKDGSTLPCDLLVMAVGIRPSTTLAQAAGLAVGRGITVDDHLRTSDPSIFALGECVELNGALFGLVAPLYDQAEVLAANLTGADQSYIPKETSTKLKVTGCDLFSAGCFAEGPDREEILLSAPEDGIYKRLVIAGQKLVGAVIYGDTEHGGFYYGLIRDGADISDLREALIFGPASANAAAQPSRCSLAG
ncbi:FAD-dependent oxidoreductase [Thioclava sp. GXIMD4216]|uniref:NAD(P)/FAD-dependent oxidoreductase n=1 Tax=Thioclava sp. GXIMD4216 TaxID=3131929 RepID=UPI0030D41703